MKTGAVSRERTPGLPDVADQISHIEDVRGGKYDNEILDWRPDLADD